MSTIADLPPSAVRDYRQPTSVGIQGLATAGQVAEAEESWICLLNERTDFLNAVIGFPVVVGGPTGFMIRTVPLQHPEYPKLYAVRASSTGLGYTDQSTVVPGGQFWKYCKIKVGFASRPYDMSGVNAFLSISGNPATRQIPAPAMAMRVGGLPPVYDPGDEIDGEDMTITLHALSAYDPTAFDAIRNCVNNATFRGRAIGTVLYRGTTYNASSNFDGLQWDASHTLSYSKVPWNYGYLPDGTLANITRADGSLRHPLADLSVLLS